MFRIEIETEGFPDLGVELMAVLERARIQIGEATNLGNGSCGLLRDSNGAGVGHWEIVNH